MKSSAQQAYEYLREAIVEGRYPGGTRLREVDVASRVRASRTPVREALQRLAADGLVLRTPEGLVVRGLTDEDILAIYELRVPLERLAAELAARHITPLQLAQLRALQAGMESEAAAATPEFTKIAILNVQFHRLISRATQNEYLTEFIARLYNAVRRSRRTTFAYPGRLEQALREHAELIAALVARDPKAAARIGETHIRGAMQIRLQMYAEEARQGSVLP